MFKTMNNVFSMIGVSLLALAAPCLPVAGADLQTAIMSFPKISAETYRPDIAVDSANTLIAAGNDAATAALEKIAMGNHDLDTYSVVNEKVCHLCRLLFIPTNGAGPLRPPKLGAMRLLPADSMNPLDWPDLPFVISKNIPLSMTVGYSGAGVAERGEAYLAYCKLNGTFRVSPFERPTTTTASNALNQVLSSPAWKALDWKAEGLGSSYTSSEQYAKRVLWRQVENTNKQIK